jgi:hypothetical protein
MPITRPSPSNSGPPEFPRLIGASIWIAFETAKPPRGSESIDRPIAETTPTESEVCLPNGLPIAARAPRRRWWLIHRAARGQRIRQETRTTRR